VSLGKVQVVQIIDPADFQKSEVIPVKNDSHRIRFGEAYLDLCGEVKGVIVRRSAVVFVVR
jgi:hypothetical protein